MPAGAGTVGSRYHEVPWYMHTAYTATPGCILVCSMPHTADTFLLLLLSNTWTSYQNFRAFTAIACLTLREALRQMLWSHFIDRETEAGVLMACPILQIEAHLKVPT